MELRIKEICREKGITLKEIAEKLGISNVNLSNSLNGNPTLNRLGEVAEVLGVEVHELFKRSQNINGVIIYNDVIYPINNYQNLFDLADKIKQENE